MNKPTRILALISSVVCLGTAFAFTACNNGGHEHTFATEWSCDETNHWHAATCEHKDEKGDLAAHTFSGDTCTVCGYERQPEVTMYTVTFNLNYPGAAAAEEVEVEEGNTVAKPADPVRNDYVFTNWTVDEEGKTVFSFSTEITQDIELYAQWISASTKTYNVTFNYGETAENDTVKVEDGKTVAKPTDPTGVKTIKKDIEHIVFGPQTFNYEFSKAEFLGWYADAEFTTEFDFNAAITKDTTVYAKFGDTTYNFEAELTDLEGKTGYGYSISYNDAGIIRYDNQDRNQGASMGFSIGYLYTEDISIEFVIYSDRDVDNVTLTARLSAEYRDIYIAPERTPSEDCPTGYYEAFEITVNDDFIDYDPIALTGAKGQGDNNQRPFDDHVISTTVSLKEGENIIQLYVANTCALESTITAMAPMVDSISLTTDAVLSWEPVWDNLAVWEEHTD